MAKELAGQVALVTGAARGIGAAVAQEFAAQGAAVLLADYDLAGAEQAALAIESTGGRALAYEMDVRRPEQWRCAVEAAVERWGGLNLLVNNAGFDRPGGVQKVSLDHWRQVLEVHLTACLVGMQSVTPAMQEAGGGRIVNLSSVYAKIGGHGEAAYSAAKAGIVGLTKSAARELARYNILVNAVLPGLTDTPAIRQMMSDKIRDRIIAETPLRRLGEPREIAAVIVFLCGPGASFVTGAAWEVSGGWNM